MGKTSGAGKAKKQGRRTTVRVPDDLYAMIQGRAETRGRSLNTTLVDLIEHGFYWFREHSGAAK